MSVRSKHLRLFCLAICLSFGIAGLWPFNFLPRNRVEWLSNGAGLRFELQSMIYSPEQVAFGSSGGPDTNPAACSIELWLKTETKSGRGLPYIFSIHDGWLPESLVIGQWRESLVLRVRRSDAVGGPGYRERGVANALPKDQWRFITVTFGTNGTCFYVDGVPAGESRNNFLSSPQLQGRLILGDAAIGHHEWRGQCRGVALYHRSLTPAEIREHCAAWTNHQARSLATTPGLAALYVFDQAEGRSVAALPPHQPHLAIPQRYRVLSPSILVTPWARSPRSGDKLADIFINIVGFVPFGLLFLWYRLARGAEGGGRGALRLGWEALLVVCSGAALSLSIELLQVLLPSRFSSMTDLLCNTVGTLLGVVLLPAAHRFLRRARLLPDHS